MNHMENRRKFELNTEPHVAEVGEHEFKFKPEVYSDEYLDAWANMQAMLAGLNREDKDPTAIKERAVTSTTAIKEFVAALMLPESAELFATIKLPDRVLLEIERWVLEVYGLRPTGSSSGSSEPSSTTTPSDPSTDDSSSEGSTS